MMRRADNDHPLAREHPQGEIVGQRVRRLREREIETPFAYLIEQRTRAVERQLDIDPAERGPEQP